MDLFKIQTSPHVCSVYILGVRFTYLAGSAVVGLHGVGSVQFDSRSWWRRWCDNAREDFLMVARQRGRLTEADAAHAFKIGANRNAVFGMDADLEPANGYVTALCGPFIMAFRGAEYEVGWREEAAAGRV